MGGLHSTFFLVFCQKVIRNIKFHILESHVHESFSREEDVRWNISKIIAGMKCCLKDTEQWLIEKTLADALNCFSEGVRLFRKEVSALRASGSENIVIVDYCTAAVS